MRKYKWKAYADRAGVIGFTDERSVPDGTICFYSASSERAVRAVVEPTSRVAYDNRTLLVPGIPEAKDGDAAINALIAHQQWLLDRRTKRGGRQLGEQ